MKNQISFLLFTLLLFSTSVGENQTPHPYGAIPSERQWAWHELETYAFVHFTINTFTNKEWGFGDESPTSFDPTDFDADQIVAAAKQGGLKGIVLTAKHHDGFCLWPSQYTEHDIANSPFRDGKGDLVREMADACQRAGLKFGVYLSPWDRHHPDYGKPKYITYYRNQLTELLTQYGPLFEIWFDGANGGDGWYGGANETRKIDNLTYYDWENTWKLVRQYQPNAIMFSDGGPDIRWVGNEKGYAGDPCWATINAEHNLPGVADPSHLIIGDANGSHWMPAEVDVSIRPGWFYHAEEDTAVKTPEKLYQIYFESVGRGANLILNLAPDQRGLIPEIDVQSLKKWRSLLETTFAHNIAESAQVSDKTNPDQSSNIKQLLTDQNRETYWMPEATETDSELIFTFPENQCFNTIDVREYLPLGQRIRHLAVDAWDQDQQQWAPIQSAESIGNRRLITVPNVTTQQVRLRVMQSDAPPAISEIGFYYGFPDLLRP